MHPVSEAYPAVEAGQGQRGPRTDWCRGLGVIGRVYRRDLVDEVIAETRSKEKRGRLLPARLVVY
jgi:hypothetical protein